MIKKVNIKQISKIIYLHKFNCLLKLFNQNNNNKIKSINNNNNMNKPSIYNIKKIKIS